MILGLLKKTGFTLRILALVLCPLQISSTAAERLAPFETISDPAIQRYIARIVQRVPHDPQLFTQGLAFDGESLWESVGRYGYSRIIRYRADRWMQSLHEVWDQSLARSEFGEGLAILNGTVYQLTWKAGRVHRYKVTENAVTPLSDFEIDREGWGMTTDGQNLITSDGSDTLVFRSSENFSAVRDMRVTLQGQPLKNLNELEFIDGAIWANVWGSPFVVVINRVTGQVTTVIDCRDLVKDAEDSVEGIDVLNGIAQDPITKEIYLTGKLWPWIYRIRLERSA